MLVLPPALRQTPYVPLAGDGDNFKQGKRTKPEPNDGAAGCMGVLFHSLLVMKTRINRKLSKQSRCIARLNQGAVLNLHLVIIKRR